MLKQKQDEAEEMHEHIAGEMMRKATEASFVKDDGEDSDAVNKTYIEQMETRMKEAFKRQVTVTAELKDHKKKTAALEEAHK